MRLTECTVRGDGASLLTERCGIVAQTPQGAPRAPRAFGVAHLFNLRRHDPLGATGAWGGTVRAKRARAAGLPQRLKRCVAMWCDALRRVAERCDAPRRVALPTVMSISPTRLIDDPTWCSREATSRQRCCHKTCAS